MPMAPTFRHIRDRCRLLALTVLYPALTVLYLAFTVLYLALTVLYLALTILCLALTVLYVPTSQAADSHPEDGLARAGRTPGEVPHNLIE